jgi:hypothetical protein
MTQIPPENVDINEVLATVQIDCTDGPVIMSWYFLKEKFDIFEVKFESYPIPFTKRELALVFIFTFKQCLPLSVQDRLKLLNIMNFLGLKNSGFECPMFIDMLLESFGTSPAFKNHQDAWDHIWQDFNSTYPTISELAEKLPDILIKYSIS